MVAKEITSPQHKLVKEAVKIRSDKETRHELGLALVPGKKMVLELAKHFEPKIVFFITTAPPFPSKDLYQVTPSIMKKITGLQSPDDLAAIFPIPEEDQKSHNHLLILDELQDPGNVGTLFRTALALGWNSIILTPNTVDPFNDKAIRASRGAVFLMPRKTLEREKIKELPDLYLADLNGKDLQTVSFSSSNLILSHESRGAHFTFQKNCTKIKIPMNPKVESLNVAVSGSILLYQMRPR